MDAVPGFVLDDEVDLASVQSFPASDVPPWTLGTDAAEYRVEHDSMGAVRIPLKALYGAQTERAVANFPISQYRLQPEFVRALGLIKACAARANGELGILPAPMAAAIALAGDQIADGMYFDKLVVVFFVRGWCR
jgi:fumarate hydratase class II